MWGWTVEDCDSLKPARSFLHVCPKNSPQIPSCSLVDSTVVDTKEGDTMEDFATFLASRRSSIFEFEGFWPQGSCVGCLDDLMLERVVRRLKKTCMACNFF